MWTAHVLLALLLACHAEDLPLEKDAWESELLMKPNPLYPDLDEIQERRLQREEEAFAQEVEMFMTEDNDTEDEVDYTFPNRDGAGRSRYKRDTIDMTGRYWPFAIVPYTYADTLPLSSKVEVDAAMQRVTRFSCVTFVPWVKNVTRYQYNLPDEAHIVFVKKQGCSSTSIGNNHKAGGISVSCCSRTVCIHELGHVLGLIHEHQSPSRRGFLRVNWQNVDPNSLSLLKENDPGGVQLLRYDITSHMHYYLNIMKKDIWPSMTVLFKDLMPPMGLGAPRSNFYYVFSDMAMTLRCQADFCANFDMDCVNDGYVTLVDRKCQCVCPHGLEPRNGCRTGIQTDVLAPDHWPSGSYGLLSTFGGCPNSLFTPTGEHADAELIDHTRSFHLMADPHGLNYTLCWKDSSSDVENITWQEGRYCLLVKFGQKCLKGFATSVPLSLSTMNLTLCCRSDGYQNVGLNLPISTPFILLPIQSYCQDVEGMLGIWENVKLNSTDKNVQLPSKLPVTITKQGVLNINFCYYYKPKTACGDTFKLTRGRKSAVFTSPEFPNNYTNALDCHWLITGPEDASITLQFTDFHVGRDSTSCSQDHVQIRSYHPGQKTRSLCGSKLDRTFRSFRNIMIVELRTELTTGYGGFRAAVNLVLPENHCFNQTDNGISYRGQVNFTRDFQPCLRWDQVTQCPHHMFNPADFDSMLEENYCRNPDNSFRPWCYTEAYEGLCERNYCDVCRLENAYDTFSDCKQLKAEGLCDGDQNLAMARCAKTCAVKLPSKEPSFSCGAPPQLDDSFPTSHQTGFRMGETVSDRCPYGPETLTRRCLSDGTWSPGNFVCGVCPTGWAVHSGACYKFVDKSMMFEAAEVECTDRNSYIATAKTTDELNFIVSLRRTMWNIWLGVSRRAGTSEWIWMDGFRVTDAKIQKARITDNHHTVCAIVLSEKANNAFKEQSCHQKNPFVCKMVPGPRRECINRRWDCHAVVRRNPRVCVDFPDFAGQQCAFTCGLCQAFITPFCTVERPTVNVVDTRNMTYNSVPRGDVITYACRDGFVLARGDLSRVCQDNGWLSGETPVCQEITKSLTPSNQVPLVYRPDKPASNSAYVGNNSLNIIQRSGEIIQWRFYASGQRSVVFQVWRPRTDIGERSYEFVGQNLVWASADRVNIADIPLQDRIRVEPGDVTALYTGSPIAPVTVHKCKSNLHPEGTRMRRIKQADASLFQMGKVYQAVDETLCMIFSMTAYINETSPNQWSRTNFIPMINRPMKTQTPGYVYTGNNEHFRFRVSGRVVQWKLFTSKGGQFGLQVWRPKEDAARYEFIGQNIVQTSNSSSSTFDISGSEQIQVKVDDTMGFWIGDPPGVIPYTACGNSRTAPYVQLQAEGGNSSFFNAGQVYSFQTVSGCRAYSLVAFVEETP